MAQPTHVDLEVVVVCDVLMSLTPSQWSIKPAFICVVLQIHGTGGHLIIRDVILICCYSNGCAVAWTNTKYSSVTNYSVQYHICFPFRFMNWSCLNKLETTALRTRFFSFIQVAWLNHRFGFRIFTNWIILFSPFKSEGGGGEYFKALLRGKSI